MRLHGQVAVVIGASSGIGEAIGRRFAKEGAAVLLAARDEAKLKSIAKGIAKEGGESTAIRVDATREADVVALFKTAIAKYQTVDILINSAGLSIGGPTHEMSFESWSRVIETNLTATFLACREALKVMVAKRSGRIVNIGSVSAKVPRPNSAPYTTSKFAIDGLTRSMALDYRDRGISVSVLHPGNTETPIWKGAESRAAQEGIMQPDTVAEFALHMVTLPNGVGLLEGVLFPITMPLLGRG